MSVPSTVATMPATKPTMSDERSPAQHREHFSAEVVGAEPVLFGRGHESQAYTRARIDMHEHRGEKRDQDDGAEEAETEEKGRRLQETAQHFHCYLPPACDARTRGSKNPIRMSTVKLAMSTVMVTRSAQPVITG